MSRPEITILTDPMPWGRELLYEIVRRTARRLRNLVGLGRAFYNHPIYRGHFAVTRSLVEGFDINRVQFNYNPIFPWLTADTIIVLSGVRTLRQAISLKRKGKIKKLFAGPNIVIFASDHNSILASTEIDGVITPSRWVIDLYLEDEPRLNGITFSWPAGVNINYWKPDPLIRRDTILIYDKKNTNSVGPYVDYLHQLGWPVEIIKYGSFTHEQYLSLLQRSILMLGFVDSESQGIAWTEAWSTNVPTMILKISTSFLQQRQIKSSAAPYLCPQNGLFFEGFEDFKVRFEYWLSHKSGFSPREWVLKNMSDEVCASIIYKKLSQC